MVFGFRLRQDPESHRSRSLPEAFRFFLAALGRADCSCGCEKAKDDPSTKWGLVGVGNRKIGEMSSVLSPIAEIQKASGSVVHEDANSHILSKTFILEASILE